VTGVQTCALPIWADLSNDERESIALAEKGAMIVIRSKCSRWFREDSFRPYSGRIELDTTQCIADLNEFALSIFKTAAEICIARANSTEELESSLHLHVQSIIGQVRSFGNGVPVEIRVDFEVEVPDKVQHTLEADLNTILLRFLDGKSKTRANERQAGLSFWESLRQGFMQLRAECAIDPPLRPAGQLSAIWESQPEPGTWRLNYRSGSDGRGLAKRFQLHEQSAAARLGFKGQGDAPVAFWLDQIKRDAPLAHVRRLVAGGSLESIELLDICGLSSDYCRKCEADDTPKRHNWLESLSKDDPNYDIATRFELKAWADSWGVVADGLGGRLSLPDLVERCANTFSQSAEAHVGFKDEAPISEKCRQLDRNANLFIEQFSNKLRFASDRIGYSEVEKAVGALSQKVHEILARSKQRIYQAAAAQKAERANDPAFRTAAEKYPNLSAHWDHRQKHWTLRDRPVDKEGNPDPNQTVPAGSDAVDLMKESARIAISQLRCSHATEVRALAVTLREPLYVWFDLMRENDRGFRRVPESTRWRGGKSIEEFQRSGTLPPDARLTESGTIAHVLQESAAFWRDLVALGFDADTPAAPARPTAAIRSEIRDASQSSDSVVPEWAQSRNGGRKEGRTRRMEAALEYSGT